MAIKINNRRTYTIDDYLRDRNQPAQNVANNNPLLMQYTQPKAQSLSGSRLDRVHTMAAIDAENKNSMYGPAAPNSSVELPRWMTDPPVATTTGGQVSNSTPVGANIPGRNSIWAAGNISSMDRATGTGVTPSVGVKADASGWVEPKVEEGDSEPSEGEGLTEGEVVSTIVTSDTKNKMDASLKDLEEFFAKGFQYKEKESPLYSILQKQMADEARLASGRAYSRAVANAGGFGSSYATLAAEEASRQVMEGWDEQQLALYQAAKEEWDSQFQSKMDEYNFWSARHQQEQAEADEANALFSSAMAAVRESYGAEYIESAIRADLEAMNLSEEQIVQILANQKSYSEAMKAGMLTTETAIESLRGKYKEDEYNEGQMTLYLQSLGYKDEAIKGALDYWSQYKQAASTGDGSETISGTAQDALAEWQAENGSAYSPDLMRAFFAGRGYNEEVINQVIGAQKDIAKGELMDAFASVNTYQDAATYGEKLNEARRRGVISDAEWKKAVEKNSAVFREKFVGTGSLNGQSLLDAADMVKEGIVTSKDFAEILKKAFKSEVETVKKEVGKKFNTLAECRKLLDPIYEVLDFANQGVISKEEAAAVIKSFASDETVKAAYDKLLKIAGRGDDEKIARLEGVNSESDKAAWEFFEEIMSQLYET